MSRSTDWSASSLPTAAQLTARQLNRATLARQLLLERESVDAVSAVRRIAAVQAQEPASPYLALWNRITGFDARELDRAFGAQQVIKASLMRMTLHAVHAADYPHLYNAMAAMTRASRLRDPRFARTGLAPDQVDGLVADAIGFATEPRTNAEFDAWFELRHGPTPDPGVWWALRFHARVVHAATGDTWAFGRRPAYVAPRVQHVVAEPEESMRYLARRYLEGVGPASAADLAQFARIGVTAARTALQAQSESLVTMTGPAGTELWDVPGGALPQEDVPAPPRLMAMWDSVLLAYADRGRIIPPDYRKLITRNNGDTLAAVLVDGYVAGVWRAVANGIEVTAFHPLPKVVWRALAAEAADLVAFLAAREPVVYSRYARWWAALPAASVRLLPD